MGCYDPSLQLFGLPPLPLASTQLHPILPLPHRTPRAVPAQGMGVGLRLENFELRSTASLVSSSQEMFCIANANLAWGRIQTLKLFGTTRARGGAFFGAFVDETDKVEK